MKLEELKGHIKTLAELPVTEAPVVSCYLDLSVGKLVFGQQMYERFAQIQSSIDDERTRKLLDEPFNSIEEYVLQKVSSISKGVAIFVRGGESPFFLPIQFRVRTPTWISVGKVPNIYHLVELKDTYHRYVVLLFNQDSARIFEIHLGAVTRQLWMDHPELRQRVGGEWTKLQYQDSRRELGRWVIKEVVAILNGLISVSDYDHLILAGDPKRIAEVQKVLPKRLKDRLMDSVHLSGQAKALDVVESTIGAFIAKEETESKSMVEQLSRAFYKDDLAVIGAAESLQALLRDQASAVVMTQTCDLGSASFCEQCGWAAVGEPAPDVCAECSSESLTACDVREEIARLAELNGCEIETVKESEELVNHGGVGCLLRYKLDSYSHPAGVRWNGDGNSL